MQDHMGPRVPCRRTWGTRCVGVWEGGGEGGGQWGWRFSGSLTCSRGPGGRYLGAGGSLGLVLSAAPRRHPTLFVHRSEGARALFWAASHPGSSPLVGLGSTQGVVWYDVAPHCVVLCCVVLCCVALRCVVLWCGVLWCSLVCRRRRYQRAKAGMSTHGYRSTGGLYVLRARCVRVCFLHRKAGIGRPGGFPPGHCC